MFDWMTQYSICPLCYRGHPVCDVEYHCGEISQILIVVFISRVRRETNLLLKTKGGKKKTKNKKQKGGGGGGGGWGGEEKREKKRKCFFICGSWND